MYIDQTASDGSVAVYLPSYSSLDPWYTQGWCVYFSTQDRCICVEVTIVFAGEMGRVSHLVDYTPAGSLIRYTDTGGQDVSGMNCIQTFEYPKSSLGFSCTDSEFTARQFLHAIP